MPTVRLNKSQIKFLDTYSSGGHQDEFKEHAKDKKYVKSAKDDFKGLEKYPNLTPVKVSNAELIYLTHWFNNADDREDEENEEGFELPEEPINRAKSVMETRAKYARANVEEAPKAEPPKPEGKGTLARFQPDYFKQKSPEVKGYSKEVSELTPNQLSNIKVKTSNPLTIIKPLRPNILDQMAIDNVNWLASQKRKAGSKWVPVQTF